MLFSYGYGRLQNQRWRTNAPPSDPVRRPHWSAGAMPLTSTDGGGPGLHSKPLDTVIGQVFAPYPPVGWQGCIPLKKDEKTPYLPAISLAVMVRRYDTKRIARWRGSMATPEATGPRHQVSIAADSINGSCKSQFFPSFFIVDPLKRGLGRRQDP